MLASVPASDIVVPSHVTTPLPVIWPVELIVSELASIESTPALTVPSTSKLVAETARVPDDVSDAVSVESLLIVSDWALTNEPVVQVTVVELRTSSAPDTLTVLWLVHAVLDRDAAPRVTPPSAVHVTLDAVRSVASSVEVVVTVLEVTLSSVTTSGLCTLTKLLTMRNMSSVIVALPLAGTVTVPTFVNAVVGVLSMISVRFEATSV